MCMACWEEAGKPLVRNKKTEAAAVLVEKVYEYHSAGGQGHIVFDDWNLDDDSVQWCIENFDDSDADDSNPFVLEALKAFRNMTEEERASALAILLGMEVRDGM